VDVHETLIATALLLFAGLCWPGCDHTAEEDEVLDVGDVAQNDLRDISEVSQVSTYTLIRVTDESDGDTSLGTKMDTVCVRSASEFAYPDRFLTAGFGEEPPIVADPGDLLTGPLSATPWPEPERCEDPRAEYRFQIGGFVVLEMRDPIETGEVIIPADCSSSNARYRVELGMIRPDLMVDDIEWYPLPGDWREHTQWFDLGVYAGAATSYPEVGPMHEIVVPELPPWQGE